MGRVAELEEGVGALLLLLLAMEIEDGEINVVEQLGVVLDGVTAAEEDNNLLLLVLHRLEEREEQDETLVGLAKNVALLQALNSAELLLLVDVDVEGARAQRDASKIL